MQQKELNLPKLTEFAGLEKTFNERVYPLLDQIRASGVVVKDELPPIKGTHALIDKGEFAFRNLPQAKGLPSIIAEDRRNLLADRRQLLTGVTYDLSRMSSNALQPSSPSFDLTRKENTPGTYLVTIDWHSGRKPVAGIVERMAKTASLSSLIKLVLYRNGHSTSIDLLMCQEVMRALTNLLFFALGKDLFSKIVVLFSSLLKNNVVQRIDEKPICLRGLGRFSSETFTNYDSNMIWYYSSSQALCFVCEGGRHLTHLMMGNNEPVCDTCYRTNPYLFVTPMTITESKRFNFSMVKRCWDSDRVIEMAEVMRDKGLQTVKFERSTNEIAKRAFNKKMAFWFYVDMYAPLYYELFRKYKYVKYDHTGKEPNDMNPPPVAPPASSGMHATTSVLYGPTFATGYKTVGQLFIPRFVDGIRRVRVVFRACVVGPDPTAQSALPDPLLIPWLIQRSFIVMLSTSPYIPANAFEPITDTFTDTDNVVGMHGGLTVYDVNGNYSTTTAHGGYFTSDRFECEIQPQYNDSFWRMNPGSASLFFYVISLDSASLPGNVSLNWVRVSADISLYGSANTSQEVELTQINLTEQNVPVWISPQKQLPLDTDLIVRRKSLNGANGSFTGTDDHSQRFSPVVSMHQDPRRQAELDSQKDQSVTGLDAKGLVARRPVKIVSQMSEDAEIRSTTRFVPELLEEPDVMDKREALTLLTKHNRYVALLALGDSSEYDYQEPDFNESDYMEDDRETLLRKQREELSQFRPQIPHEPKLDGSGNPKQHSSGLPTRTALMKAEHAKQRTLFDLKRGENIERLRQQRSETRKRFFDECMSSKERFIGFILANGMSCYAACNLIETQKPLWYNPIGHLCSADPLVVALTILNNKKYPNLKERALVYCSYYYPKATRVLAPEFVSEFVECTEQINELLSCKKFDQHKIACSHCKFDGKAKQPNDIINPRFTQLKSSHGEVTEGDDLASRNFLHGNEGVKVTYPENEVKAPPVSSNTTARPLAEDVARARGFVYGLQTAVSTVDTIIGDIFSTSQRSDNVVGPVSSMTSRESCIMGRRYILPDGNHDAAEPIRWLNTRGVITSKERNTYTKSAIQDTIVQISARMNATVTMTNGFYNTDILNFGQISQPGDLFDYQFMKLWAYCFSIAPTGFQTDTVPLRGSIEHVASDFHFNYPQPNSIIVSANTSPVFGENLPVNRAPTRAAGSVWFITNLKAMDNDIVSSVVAVPSWILQQNQLTLDVYMRLLAVMWVAGPNNIMCWLISIIQELTDAETQLFSVPYSGMIATTGLKSIVFLLPCASAVVPLPLNQNDADRAPIGRPTIGGLPIAMSFTGQPNPYLLTTWMNDMLDPALGLITPHQVVSFINLMSKELNCFEASHSAFHRIQALSWRIEPLQIAAYGISYQDVIGGDNNGQQSDVSGMRPLSQYAIYPAVTTVNAADYIFPEGTIVRYNQIVVDAVDVISSSTAGPIIWLQNQYMHAQMEARRYAMCTQLFFDSLHASQSDIALAMSGTLKNRTWVNFFGRLFQSPTCDHGINIARAGDLWNDFANEYLGTSLYLNDFGHNLMHFKKNGLVQTTLTGAAIQTERFRPMWYPDMWMDLWTCKDLMNYCQPNDNRMRNNLQKVPNGEFPFGVQIMGAAAVILPKPVKQPNNIVSDQWAVFGDIVTRLNQRLCHYYTKEQVVEATNGFIAEMMTTVGNPSIYTAAYQFLKGQTANAVWADQGYADLPQPSRGAINPYAMFSLTTGEYFTRNPTQLVPIVLNLYKNIVTLPLSRLIYQFDAPSTENFLTGESTPCPFDNNIDRKTMDTEDNTTIALKESPV